jgi:6-phosphogluconolactonase (cycloisomerase 2 family)
MFRTSAILLSAAAFASALAQSSVPAAFVANNGNLEGSVTAYTFDPNGAPVFADKLVIGSRPDIQTPEPGANAYCISITPNGRFLAVGHAASDDPFQQITVINVASDATLSLAREAMTPDTPLDIAWIDDEYLAVLRTDLSIQNQVIVYRWNGEEASLTEVDRGDTGPFTSSLAVHPSGQFIYAGDSSANAIYVFAVARGGQIGLLQTTGTPAYPLGICVSPDGTKLFGGGGISNGGDKVIGFDIAPDGTLSAMTNSPFTSPGASPKGCAVSADSTIVYVGHGTDSTVRSFLIDEEADDLISTGFSFDVGLQGSLGNQVILGDLLLMTDNTTAIDGIRGMYAFDTFPNGNFTMNGDIVDSQGISPRDIATWIPVPQPCPGDVDGDQDADLDDLTLLLQTFGLCSGDAGFNPAADLDGNGCVDLDDLTIQLQNFGTVCA